ncbi:MAG TPA: CHAT domain-containing protein, partial [Anaerolineae bacterium]|nr:CHAT domain-containing protein [Anaerolineae bacterium]
CDFVLHGHLHQSAATRLSSPDGEATVLACGACYQTREYPNMVNWVRLDLTTGIGTVHLRRYSDARGGFWAPDTLTYRNAPGGTYTFRIQGLPSVPEPPAPPHPEPVSTAQPAHSPAEPSSGHLLHITIQAGSGKTWPVVAEHKPPGDDLPVRDEGLLRIDGEALRGSADAQEYGTILGQALFQGHILRAFDQAFGASAHDLRVLLYVDAEDLRTQHWERLCAPLDRGWDHLALDQRLPFSLALPSRADRRFPPIEGDKLRALVVVASPEGLDAYNLRPFDVARTVAGVQAGLDPIPPDLLAVHPGAAGPPTLEALIDRLIDGHYALLHIVCHGSFRQELDDTVLYLANEDGRVEPVPATILITRLGRLRGGSLPYFAFLATCESASPQAEGALGGLAHRLVREVGIPAVLAMTEKVSLRTAVDLGARFYERLKVHGEPDRALVEACSRLAARGDVTVPALYSRLAGRPLFQPTPTPQEPDPVPAPPSDEPDVQETLPTIHIDPDDPPYAALRELLNAAFDPDGLHRFCQERRAFRPVLRRFGPGHGLDNMIDELLEYCRTQLLWDELVAEIARVQPRQVARFADRLR